LSLKKLVFLVAILLVSAVLSISLSQQSSPPTVNGSDLVLLLNETFEVEKNDLAFFDVELKSAVTVVGYFEENNFTFMTDYHGTYYFAFDNERLVEGGLCYDRNITFRLCRE
jgi:hypothetical protein